MKGLYLNYKSMVGGGNCKIKEFMFDGETSYRKAHNKDAGEGMWFTLKCKCGSNNWRDNGRCVNEYECDSCSQFVTVLEDNQLTH